MSIKYCRHHCNAAGFLESREIICKARRIANLSGRIVVATVEVKIRSYVSLHRVPGESQPVRVSHVAGRLCTDVVVELDLTL